MATKEEKDIAEKRKKVRRQKVQGVRCIDCDSNMTYYRLKDNTIVCRKCGHVQEAVSGKGIIPWTKLK
jgi:ribosomal protein S27E